MQDNVDTQFEKLEVQGARYTAFVLGVVYVSRDIQPRLMGMVKGVRCGGIEMREVGKLTLWESVEDKGVRGGKV